MFSLYAVNLIHGIGTEIDRYAILSVNENREKRGIFICYNNVGIDDPPIHIILTKRSNIIYYT